MRLKKIRLAGFKSFIDPVDIIVPSDINAIVGPNGCGKSNVVDAVRWILGDSAKHLRTELSADIIFNGSQSRPAASQASAELVLDNSDGRVTGPYGQYSEISLKRTISRDQQANYYLNGRACRRKDVIELLYGTGLGPRSYAIIEQELVAKLVVAKPEEMRVYIEQAAGVSKYKERRRESEIRIKHTRDNLSRLDDIRIENKARLETLQEHAKLAEVYTELKQQQRELEGQLYILRWTKLNKQLQQQLSLVTQQEANLAQIQKQFKQLQSISTEKTQCMQVTREQLSRQQASYYQLGTDIARLEEMIHNIENSYQEWQQSIKQNEAERQIKDKDCQSYQSQLTKLEQELTELKPQYEVLTQSILTAESQLNQERAVMAEIELKWKQFTEHEITNNRMVFETQTKINFLEQRLTSLGKDIDKLKAEDLTKKIEQIEQLLTELAEKQTYLLKEQAQIKAQLKLAQQSIRDKTQQQHAMVETRNKIQQQLQALLTQQSSLTALQEAALGQQDTEISTWLTDHKLVDHTYLAQNITVEAGWESAVEMVLGDYLQALGVETEKPYLFKVDSLLKSDFRLINKYFKSQTSRNPAVKNLLANKVSTPWTVITELLSHVYTAESLAQAIEQLAILQVGDSIVTREGYWLNHYSIKVARGKNKHQGIVKREREINQLKKLIHEERNKLASVEEELTAIVTSLRYDENQAQLQRNKYQEIDKQLQTVMTQIEVQKAQLTLFKQRQAEVEDKGSELQQQFESAQQELMQAQVDYASAKKGCANDQLIKQSLILERDKLQEKLKKYQAEVKQQHQQVNETQIALTTKKERFEFIHKNLLNSQRELEQIEVRHQALSQKIADVKPLTDLTDQLASKKERQAEISRTLANEKAQVNQLEAELATLERDKQEKHNDLRAVEEKLVKLRITGEKQQVLKDTVEQAITESAYTLKSLLEQPTDLTEQVCETKLNTCKQKIVQMGAINLVAGQEYQQACERMDYLDSQYQDLTSALQTLEQAIHKIDKETQSRLKATYLEVNERFSHLFTKLFSGGKAGLSLCGDDILSAGITVIAQPPGKKNNTLHALSGGEKALTALALVFAIFQINPSPFCMLDEVDAPLDDANVARLAELLREMSKVVQFIMITHNKFTMALAQHLIGVTMRERGVSKIVSVDLDNTMSLAGA